MKKVLIILVVMLRFTFSINAQEEQRNDLAKLNLKGKVVYVQQHLYNVEHENDKLTKEKYMFTSFDEMRYTDWSFISEILRINTSLVMKFNKKGDIDRIETDGGYDIKYNYDGGKLIGEIWYFTFHGRDTFANFRCQFDKGRLVGKSYNFLDEVAFVKYKYNSNGALSYLTSEHTMGDYFIRNYDTYFEYNSDGKIEYVQDYRYNKDEKEKANKYFLEYDEKENVSKIIVNDKYSVTYSKYQYDDHGNWIRCIIKEEENENETLTRVVTRTIRYDD